MILTCLIFCGIFSVVIVEKYANLLLEKDRVVFLGDPTINYDRLIVFYSCCLC